MMRHTQHILLIALFVLFTTSTALADHGHSKSSMTMIDPGGEGPSEVTHAVAVLQPTEGNEVTGTIKFVQQEGGKGLKVMADVGNLPEGAHGYHVHIYGDCSGADGKSAGTHFNFDGSSKNPPKDIDRITGNLGELKAESDGEATAEEILEQASLQGPYSILGRAVIVHEKVNDPDSPPIGAAGSRLACGVIGIANPESE